MHISHRHKFIFFSFPKTGSESVRKLLTPFSDIQGIPYWECDEKHPFYSHISPKEVKAIFQKNGWNYDDYYKFTFVRNPWARLVSLYNMIYHTKKPTTLLGKVRSLLKPNSAPSFKKWLQQIKADGEGAGGAANQRWQVYGSYSIANYILDENRQKLVNEVIKLEEISEKLPVVLKNIGIDSADELTIPHVNTRARKKYSTYYDDDTKQLIADRYKYDIERFNYSFDDVC